MNTPVALIVFNRPATTARVLAALREIRPRTLYVIADGARPHSPDDAERCKETRAVIETVDWECRVFKNYADTNLGLKRRVESGLDWVFARTSEAIILEDDCLPHPTFFPFCEELLARYRHEPRVMGISGNNFHFDQLPLLYSYSFSRYPLIWGWATWARAWARYDGEMRPWTRLREERWLETKLETPLMLRYWDYLFQRCFETHHTWDLVWIYSTWLSEGLHITPHVNLVSNLGFGFAATHTLNPDDPFAALPVQAMEVPLRHPPEIARDAAADLLTEENVYSGRGFAKQLLEAMRRHIHSKK